MKIKGTLISMFPLLMILLWNCNKNRSVVTAPLLYPTKKWDKLGKKKGKQEFCSYQAPKLPTSHEPTARKRNY